LLATPVRHRAAAAYLPSRLPDCSWFQFETVTELFFRYVPFHPVDFATLEIEIQKTPAILRGRFYLLTAFR
jgi:hypothetical protein